DGLPAARPGPAAGRTAPARPRRGVRRRPGLATRVLPSWDGARALARDARHHRHRVRRRERDRHDGRDRRQHRRGRDDGRGRDDHGGGGQDGRHDPGGQHRARRPARPCGDDRPGVLRRRQPVVRVPRLLARQSGADARPGRVVGAERGRLRVDLQAAPGRSLAGRRRAHARRRHRDDGAARQGRQLGPQGDHRGGLRDLARPDDRRLPTHGPERQPALPGVERQLAGADHPEGLRRRDDARQAAERHRPVEADEVRRQDGRDVRPQRRLVGRPDAPRRPGVDVLRRPAAAGRGHAAGPGRRGGPVLRPRRRGAAERRERQRGDAQVGRPPSDLDAHRQGPVRRQARPPGARSHARSRGDGPGPLPGQGGHRQRQRHRTGLPLRRPLRAAAAEGHRQGQGAPPGRRRLEHHGDAARREAAGDPRPGRPREGWRAGGGRHAERLRRGREHLLRPGLVPGEACGPALLGRRRDRDRRLRPPRHARRLPQRGAEDRGRLELVAVPVAGVRRGVPRLSGGGGRRRADDRREAAAGDPARGLPDPRAVLLQLPARALEEVPGRRDDRARPALRREGLTGL
ncbi:MAG: hypothetical protein AVDCRST_MAG79-1487, partial [uncultured Thermoleophilia bacterium]